MKKSKPPEINTRMPRADHEKLLELAKKLHIKPGVLAGWLLEIYRHPGQPGQPNQPDEHTAGLVLLSIVLRCLDQLAQRLVRLDGFIVGERDLAEPKSTQYLYAEDMHQDLTRLRKRLDTESDLCQAIAAMLIGNKLPADLLAALQAAEAIRAAGPDPDDEPLNKMLAYLVATRILYLPPPTT
jgi:hypothetical protein